MKIAIITVGELPLPSVKGGGAETLIEQILEENEKTGYFQFNVYSIDNELAKKRALQFRYADFTYLKPMKKPVFSRLKRKIIKIKTGFDIPIGLYNYKKIVKTLKEENYDYILIENTMVPFYQYTKIFGEKIILHTHWDYINASLPDVVLRKYKAAALKCAKIITVSNYIKKCILTVPELNEEKVVVLKNCTDLNRFQIPFSEEEKIELRHKYHIKADDIVLVFTGRISKEKGVVELAEAFKIVGNKRNVKLVIVGSAQTGNTIVDEYTQTVYEILETVKNNVIYTGYIDYCDMPKIYHMADIAILPSTGQDPAPLTIFEAMASGLPIITTYSGGIPEYANEDCALFSAIDEEIIDSLAENMEKLISNEKLRLQMAENAFNRAKLFGTEKYYFNFKTILDEMNKRKKV